MADVVRSVEASRLTAGVPEQLAERATVWPLLHTGFDLVEIAAAHDLPIRDVAAVEWAMFDRLDLTWLWDGIGALPRSDRWQTQARSAVRDDLLTALAELTGTVIDSAGGSVDAWLEANERSVGPGPGDVHRDPPRRELRPDHAVGRPAPAAQPGPDERDLVRRRRARIGSVTRSCRTAPASASPRRRPGSSTSAGRARRCSTGRWRGASAARSCCASRTPTRPATGRSGRRGSSTPWPGSASPPTTRRSRVRTSRAPTPPPTSPRPSVCSPTARRTTAT